MRKNIEDKLDEVYKFTLEYLDTNGFPPSVRDICSRLGIKSTATAYSYIEKLRERGLLNKSPLKKRAITLNNKITFKSIPIIGTIRAGSPVFAYENLDGYVPLPAEIGENGADFALKVQGDSMINAGIKENDLILVSSQESAENGQIVVALIDDSATVKRYFVRDGKIVLHPENDNMSDMIFDNVQILGVVKGLIRKF